MKDIRHIIAATMLAMGIADSAAQNADSGQSAPLETSSTAWIQVGTGVWHNCPITENNSPQTTTEWAVTFEENTDRRGLYRTAPYCSGWPLQASLGSDPTAYAIIDATDPARVHIAEFSALGIYTISQLVAENGWSGQSEYGTLTEGRITFPHRSFNLHTPLGWQNANLEGSFTITLPDKAGIGTPTADSSAADNTDTIEYFTLQGIRITRPLPGQPIILRQGTTIVKTIAR